VKKEIPFTFVLEELAELGLEIKPMFGCHAIYVGDKIVLILREKESETYDNGLWVATFAEHHASLRADFSALRHIRMFGPGPTGWQNLPVSHPEFEDQALALCAAIKSGDVRIGKIPASRKKKLKPLTRVQKAAPVGKVSDKMKSQKPKRKVAKSRK